MTDAKCCLHSCLKLSTIILYLAFQSTWCFFGPRSFPNIKSPCGVRWWLSEMLVELFSSVQSLNCVRFFVTPWIAAHQASLSITNSRSSFRLTSIESVMPTSHLILGHPLLLLPPISPSISLFQWVNSAWDGQSTGVSALASFLPKKSQYWSPSEWIGWISLQSKGLSRVFSNTTVQTHQFFSAQPSSQSNF